MDLSKRCGCCDQLASRIMENGLCRVCDAFKARDQALAEVESLRQQLRGAVEDFERRAQVGAAALVKGGRVCEPETGDVLHDHDWTPIEAARVVLEAADNARAVSAGVWHKDGPLAQIEAMIEWLGEPYQRPNDETLSKVQTNLRASVAHLRGAVD